MFPVKNRRKTCNQSEAGARDQVLGEQTGKQRTIIIIIIIISRDLIQSQEEPVRSFLLSQLQSFIMADVPAGLVS